MDGRRGFRWGRPRWSVRSRILASILAVAALGMALAGAAAYILERDKALEAVDARLASEVQTARYIVTGASSAVGSPSIDPLSAKYTTVSEALQAIMARVIPDHYESSLGIIDGRARYVPGIDTTFSVQDVPSLVGKAASAVASGHGELGTISTPSHTIRYIATPVVVAGDPSRGVFVSAVDLDAELSDSTAAFQTYWVVVIITLAAIGIVGWFVAGRLLAPIRRLRVAASRVTASERHERIPVIGHDDVSELTNTVNDMLDRLDEALTSQRQLLDDVRHELGTPITILRGHLELLASDNRDEVDATRAIALDELDRMALLVDDIERLSETQELAPIMEEADLVELASTVFSKVSALPGHAWLAGEVASGSAVIDRGRITQAWLQLADNAAKYSPEGTAIVLGVNRFGNWIEFWVQDAGPGVPREARERIWQRFGRADTGRGVRGSGLGLPIVAAIAKSHSGYVQFDSGSRGSRFGIVVPECRREADEFAQSKPGDRS